MEQRTTATAKTLGRDILLGTGLLVIYFAAGKFGLTFFGLIHPSASPVWLPTGIAIGALLIFGRRVWLAIFVGAFLVNVTTEGSVLTSLGVATGNTLEAVVAAELVQRFAGGCDVFQRAVDIIKFACLAALLSTTISATIGVTSLTLGGYAPPAEFVGIWFTWWLGDAAGALLVTPLIVTWTASGSRQTQASPARSEVLLYASVAVVGAITFFHPAVAAYPLSFLSLTPLVWGALRFGPREIATAVALLSAIAIGATATGYGSFVQPTANESLLVLQAFMALVAVTALPMAALTRERVVLLASERAARAEADAASRAKDQFLTILSHELRNPLSGISAAASVLDNPGQAGGESQRCLGIIQRQVRHLTRLIDDLFDISRVKSGRMSLNKEWFDLGDVVRDCIRMEAAGTAHAGRIDLDLEPTAVYADRDRIQQIVGNLMGNAIRYTPGAARIRVAVAARDNEAVLVVEDEGAGIRAELLPHVFDPFRQAEQGLDRNPGGLGIGLTLVRQLAELHGGCVEAQSGGPGRGSVFVVRLPLEATPPAMRSSAVEQTIAAPTRAWRLLIVEDNDDARAGLRALLETRGYEVHDVADGGSGIAAALEIVPDVALVDIGLPIVDGYEVARRVRAANPGIRLIAVTGYGNEHDKQRARDAGFDVHLLKPVSLEQLQRAIESVLTEPRDVPALATPTVVAGAG